MNESTIVKVSAELNQKSLKDIEGLLITPVYRGGPKFSSISRLDTTEQEDPLYMDTDILELMSKMPKQEMMLFMDVKRHHNPATLLAKTDENRFSKSQLRQRYRAYASLKRKNVLRRIRKEVYMINPQLILPVKKYRESTMTQWLLAGGK